MDTTVKRLELGICAAENELNKVLMVLDEEFADLSKNQEEKTDLELSSFMDKIKNLDSDLHLVSQEIKDLQDKQTEAKKEIADRIAEINKQFLDLNCVTEALHN